MFPYENIHVKPLQYSSYSDSKHHEKVNTCMIVGLVVVGVLLMVAMQPPRLAYSPTMRHSAHVSGMLSTIRSISGRVASILAVDGVLDANKVYKQIPSGKVSLIDCPKAETDPQAWKKYSAADKKACEKHAREWLKKHDKAVIMVFAPWCGHCHKAMPLFAETSSGTQLPFLMINAEAMPREALSGAGAIYSCEYFPTFLAKHGDEIKLAKSPQEAVHMLAQKQAPAPSKATAAEKPSAPPPPAEQNDGGDPFANLF